MSDFLLEILVQELPYHFIKAIKPQLFTSFEKLFQEYGIEYSKLDVQVTPRRFAVLAYDLSDSQKDIKKEAKGPILNIALDSNGNYTPAALGFAKKNGVEAKDLIQKDNYIFANIEIKGKSTKEVLCENIENIIFKLQGAYFMRWGDNTQKFSRPIENVLALYNNEVLDIKVLDKKSTNKTIGHRFSKNKEVEIQNPKEYFEALKKANVIVDKNTRREEIIHQATMSAKSIGATIDFDDNEDLLDEVTNLLEWPCAIVCDFDNKYLEIPDIVSTTVMSKHQRYFPLFDAQGKLMNNFITMANFVGNDDESIENIKAGNQRVVCARLEDGIFFYKDDTKTSLFDKVENLKGMTFQKGLGSLYDKTMRIVDLSELIAKELGVEAEDIKRSALLSKADLSTSLVFEFTELQGFIGENYALKSNEKQNVAKAVKEHYFPLNATSELPSDIEGKVVSIADKIDTVCALFLSTQENKKKRPTGSNDPLGARRAIISILRILIENDMKLNLENIIEGSLKKLSADFNIELKEDCASDIYEFILNRLNMMYEKEFSQNILKASLIINPLVDLGAYLSRCEFLKEALKDDNFNKITQGATRVFKIVKDSNLDSVDVSLLNLEQEKNLYNAIVSIEKNPDIKEYVNSIGILVEPIEAFFENVLVNDENEKIKNNRVALLNMLKKKLFKVCDFMEI